MLAKRIIEMLSIVAFVASVIGCAANASPEVAPQNTVQPASNGKIVVPAAKGIGTTREQWVKAYEPLGFHVTMDTTVYGSGPMTTMDTKDGKETIFLYGPTDNLDEARYVFGSGDITAKLETFIKTADPTWKGGMPFVRDNIAAGTKLTSTVYNGREYLLSLDNGGGELEVSVAQ